MQLFKKNTHSLTPSLSRVGTFFVPLLVALMFLFLTGCAKDSGGGSSGGSEGDSTDDTSSGGLGDDGFDVSNISRPTSEEGRTATFTVKLTTQPTSDVIIPISSADLTEGDVSPDSLTFRSDNWDSDQTVTVTGLGDATLDGDIDYTITLGMADSSDGNFNNQKPADVAVTNLESLLTGFQFLTGNNSSLVADLTTDIIYSSKGIVTLFTPPGRDSTVDYSSLLPTLTMIADGDSTADDASADYSDPVKIAITDNIDRSQSYWVITGQKEIVPDTSQGTCYQGNTDTTTDCAGTGQDGAYSTNAPSFTDNGNGTVSDNTTGWMWQKCSYGQTWGGSACLGSPADPTWGNADTYCSNLNLGGYSSGWRLPKVQELQQLVDYSRVSPSIHSYFRDSSNTVSTYYWSASSRVDSPSGAWRVYFGNGSVYYGSKTLDSYVRCIRSGQ